MNIKPLQDRVVVKRIEEPEKTKGGIIIPDTAKEKPSEGEIVAVGKGKVADNGQLVPMELKVGDKVLFSKYGGHELKMDGEEYIIMGQDDIYAVVEK